MNEIADEKFKKSISNSLQLIDMESQSSSSRAPRAPQGRGRLNSSAAVAAAAHAAAAEGGGDEFIVVKPNPRAGNAPPPRSAARVGGTSRQGASISGGSSAATFMSPGVRSPMFRTPPSSPPRQLSPIFKSPVGANPNVRPHGSPGGISAAVYGPHSSPGINKRKQKVSEVPQSPPVPSTALPEAAEITTASSAPPHSPKRKIAQMVTPPSAKAETALSSVERDDEVTPNKKTRLSSGTLSPPPANVVRKVKSPTISGPSVLELRVLADQTIKRRVWAAYFGAAGSGRQLCPGCGQPISLEDFDFEVQTVLHLDQQTDIAIDDMYIWNTWPLCSRQPGDSSAAGGDQEEDDNSNSEVAEPASGREAEGWGCSETLERRRVEAECASDGGETQIEGVQQDYATELATSGHAFDWMVTAHPDRLHELIVRLQKAHGDSFGYPVGEALSIRFARDVYQIGKVRSDNDVISRDGEWLRRGLGFRVDIVDLADCCGFREASDRDVLRRIERRDLMTPRKQLCAAGPEGSAHPPSRMMVPPSMGSVRRSTTTASLGLDGTADPDDGKSLLGGDRGVKLVL